MKIWVPFVVGALCLVLAAVLWTVQARPALGPELWTWITDAALLGLAYALGRLHAAALYEKTLLRFESDLRDLNVLVDRLSREVMRMPEKKS